MSTLSQGLLKEAWCLLCCSHLVLYLLQLTTCMFPVTLLIVQVEFCLDTLLFRLLIISSTVAVSNFSWLSFSTLTVSVTQINIDSSQCYQFRREDSLFSRSSCGGSLVDSHSLVTLLVNCMVNPLHIGSTPLGSYETFSDGEIDTMIDSAQCAQCS